MNHIDRIRESLRGTACGGLLITSYVNRLYATGFPSSAGAALITADGAWFFTDSRYIEAAEEAVRDAEVLLVDSEFPYSKRINEALAQAGVSALGFEEEMTHAQYLVWRETLHAELVLTGDILCNLRAVKDERELAGMIAAQRIAETAFSEVLPLIGTGMTERELARELVCRFLKNGADDKSFDPIVVSGPRSSMPHGTPSDERLQKGFLTMDFGVVKDGWCSDTTRTVCIGEPTPEMRRVYDTVLRAQLAGIEAARPGARGCDVHEAAYRVIADAGYGAYFGHGFGHGLGLEVHEQPNASPSNEEKLPEGAVISAEPGIYLPGRFGVRIEDVIYLGRGGTQNITNLPKQLIVL